MTDDSMNPAERLRLLAKSGELKDFMRSAEVDEIRRDIRKLENGQQDRDAAESLLQQVRTLGANAEEQPDLFDWLYAALGRILDGMNADEAFGLKRKRGQKQRAGEVDPLAIAMYVKLKCRESMTPARAKESAVEFFAREIRTIENALRGVELAPDLNERTMWRHVHRQRRPQ